jgi:hypothetical protein
MVTIKRTGRAVPRAANGLQPCSPAQVNNDKFIAITFDPVQQPLLMSDSYHFDMDPDPNFQLNTASGTGSCSMKF